jgi:hypothetical protein
MTTSASRWHMQIAGAVAACCLAGAAVADETTPDGPQSAAWTQKELLFRYQGFTTKYSCDGLEEKVRRALLQLGARKKDLQVRGSGCASPYGRPDPFAAVRIKMSVLQPQSQAATDDKHKPVSAHWTAVDLKLSDFGQLNSSGECELVEQIKTNIVPLFTARNVQLRQTCIPHQASAGGSSLKMEVLMADPKEAHAPSTK